jgi:hypothetical protein
VTTDPVEAGWVRLLTVDDETLDRLFASRPGSASWDLAKTRADA